MKYKIGDFVEVRIWPLEGIILIGDIPEYRIGFVTNQTRAKVEIKFKNGIM